VNQDLVMFDGKDVEKVDVHVNFPLLKPYTRERGRFMKAKKGL
jgi:hypothetical protein